MFLEAMALRSLYRLCFNVPTRMEICLSRHREIGLCNFFIFKLPATPSILLVSEIFLAVLSRRCVRLLVYVLQEANGVLIDISFLWVIPVIDHKFHNIVKGAVDPQGHVSVRLLMMKISQ